jgi:hypothetical protein
MATPDQEAARAVVVRKFQEIAQAYDESLSRQKHHQEQAELEAQQQQSLIAVANDCHAAARVMGFDLIAALASFNSSQANAVIHAAPPQQQIVSQAKPISDLVLLMAELAYPEPVRAATLQAEIEKERGPLHYKTIGMTLYRLSKQGLMRRKGQKDWFFVPPEERTKKPAVGAAGQEVLFDD